MAKRIAQSSVNWSALAERVPTAQRTNFNAFKSRSDKYLRSVISNPAEAPKIDWAFYKNRIPSAALVDAFQKQYESIKIPYPADTVTGQVDAQSKQIAKEIEQFKVESRKRIEQHEKEMAHLNALIPYDQMTMEDFRNSHPELALDPINKPTFWPHTPEDQLDFKGNQNKGHGGH